MAVTALTLTAWPGGGLVANWTGSTGETYRVLVDGVLVATTTATSVWIRAAEGATVEVIDSSETIADAVAGTWRFGWYPVTAATGYQVQEWDGSAFQTVETITESGAGFYIWRSDRLDDETDYIFRVLAIGPEGDAGAVTTVAGTVGRTPDDPAVTYTYSATTGKVTLS